MNPRFDIVFISYQEDERDHNFEDLRLYYPYAKRVHNVKGIRQAHIQASKVATSEFFFTIDADNRFIPNHVLNIPNALDHDTVYVWRCQNAVNKLVYGFGGIKLWSKETFKRELTHFNDHAMSATKVYKVINDLVTVTHFNTSKYSSWRTGFREAAKLSVNIAENKDNVSKSRLDTWLTKGIDQKFGKECINGAQMGARYFRQHGKNASFDLINDFDRMEQLFNTLTLK